MLQELKDSEILLLWGHGRSHKAERGVKMEDSPFTWVSIHNGMAEKEKAQRSKIIHQLGFPLPRKQWRLTRLDGSWRSECGRS